MTHATAPDEVIDDPHPRVPWWIPDLIATALIVLAALTPFPEQEFRPTGPVTLILVLLPAVALPFRRRWPILVLIVCMALFGAASLAGTLSPGAGLAVAVAMFQVAYRSTRRRGFAIGGIATATIILLSLPVVIGNVFDPRVFQFGLIVALATAAGDGNRSRRAYIEAITERAERAERTRDDEARRRVTEERLRIARDLHDAVAHQIAVISLSAGVASSSIDARPEKAKQSLATIRDAARTVLGEIGDLLSMLRASDDTALSDAAPQPGLGRVDDLIRQFAQSGLDVQMRAEGDTERVTGAVGIVAYRVIQEALTNAHKHGAEHRAHILLEVTRDELIITVANPTAHESANQGGTTRGGLGLVGLRERVASVRGAVDAGDSPGGWKVVARLPLSKEEAK